MTILTERATVYRQGIDKTITEIKHYTMYVEQGRDFYSSQHDARKLYELSAKLYAYVTAYQELRMIENSEGKDEDAKS